MSVLSVSARLLGDSGRCVGLPALLLPFVLCFPRGVLHWSTAVFPRSVLCGFLALGVLNWSTAQVTLFPLCALWRFSRLFVVFFVLICGGEVRSLGEVGVLVDPPFCW